MNQKVLSFKGVRKVRKILGKVICKALKDTAVQVLLNFWMINEWNITEQIICRLITTVLNLETSKPGWTNEYLHIYLFYILKYIHIFHITGSGNGEYCVPVLSC